MTARRRVSGHDVKVPSSTKEASVGPEAPKDVEPEIRSPQWMKILGFSLLFFIPYFYLLLFHYEIDRELKRSILINAILSAGGFIFTLRLIPVASRYVSRRNLFGYDINKKGTPQGSIKIPESLGIVVGIVFMVLAIVFQYFNFTEDSNWLVEYNAALASICFMTLLGFVDDVLDVPWRVKLVLPSFAALPLLMAYAGHTTIVIPKPLVPFVGRDILDLGWVYKLYMGLLAVFCTNSINIHAGINGLEVGQTVVIAFAILIHNVMQIGASKDPEYQQAHAFSIYLVHPLLATSLALLCYNWYPSSVFVGDTYTYFAGMTMVVVGVLGHYRLLENINTDLKSDLNDPYINSAVLLLSMFHTRIKQTFFAAKGIYRAMTVRIRLKVYELVELKMKGDGNCQEYKQQRPSQELVAKDLHGKEWRFRHIYRGQP